MSACHCASQLAGLHPRPTCDAEAAHAAVLLHRRPCRAERGAGRRIVQAQPLRQQAARLFRRVAPCGSSSRGKGAAKTRRCGVLRGASGGGSAAQGQGLHMPRASTARATRVTSNNGSTRGGAPWRRLLVVVVKPNCHTRAMSSSAMPPPWSDSLPGARVQRRGVRRQVGDACRWDRRMPIGAAPANAAPCACMVPRVAAAGVAQGM